MPTQTFYNLASEKRERIIEAAMKEFSAYSMNDVSISQIIKHAQISRGSFYQYFEDKYDLYCYLIKQFKSNYHRLMLREFKRYQGDMYQGYLAFSLQYIEKILTSPKFGFFEQLYLNMNYRLNKESIDILFTDATQTRLVDVIDRQSLVLLDDQDVTEVLQFLHELLNQTVMEGFWESLSTGETYDRFKRRIDWLFYGILQ